MSSTEVALQIMAINPIPITPLKLHFILYQYYGWYLTFYGNPPFEDTIIAGTNGPYFKELDEYLIEVINDYTGVEDERINMNIETLLFYFNEFANDEWVSKEEKEKRKALIEVVRIIIAHANDIDKKITQLGLYKLIYIYHGWCLGLGGRSPFYPNTFRALPVGPVPSDLYNSLKGYFTCNGLDKKTNLEIEKPKKSILNIDDIQFIQNIVDFYLQYTVEQLTSITHDECWEKVSTDLFIHDDNIKDYFKNTIFQNDHPHYEFEDKYLGGGIDRK